MDGFYLLHSRLERLQWWAAVPDANGNRAIIEKTGNRIFRVIKRRELETEEGKTEFLSSICVVVIIMMAFVFRKTTVEIKSRRSIEDRCSYIFFTFFSRSRLRD